MAVTEKLIGYLLQMQEGITDLGIDKLCEKKEQLEYFNKEIQSYHKLTHEFIIKHEGEFCEYEHEFFTSVLNKDLKNY